MVWIGQVAVRATDGMLETTGTINIHVRALNDPPAISLGNSTFVTQEDNALMLLNASVVDVDADESDDNYITVEMSAVYGRLSTHVFPGVLQSKNTLVGSISQVNSALKTLTYEPQHNWNSAKNATSEIQAISTFVLPPKEIFSIRTVATERFSQRLVCLARGSIEVRKRIDTV